MIRYLLCYIFFLPIITASAEPGEPVSGSMIDASELNIFINGGLKYLEQTQILEISDTAYAGEWPSYMGLKVRFFLLGGKGRYYDSNCFNVTSIHNMLAEIYFADPSYVEVLPMLEKAMPRILSYRNGNTFNFWPQLEPVKKLKKGAEIGEQPLVRRPRNYPLFSKYINNAANVTDDADDTSMGLLALLYHQKIFEDPVVQPPAAVAPIFTEYRDTNRKNRHWYNWIYGNDYETGAFLTWLDEEYEFEKWSIIRTIGHNATFYTPSSECWPEPYEPYIPYGSNDLDAVVNSNILNVLAQYDELDVDGVQNACSFITKKVEDEKYSTAGIYYPNKYHLPYTLAKAYYYGVECLDSAAIMAQHHLQEYQETNGSWHSRKVVNNGDVTQSTAYAVNALLYLQLSGKGENIAAIEKGIQFLLDHAREHNKLIYWNGGVFFSGGTVVRNTLTWRSDAYTTALVIHALVLYKQYLEQEQQLVIEK